MSEQVEPVVCIAHGAFIPCRRDGEHRLTGNPYWVKAVADYQGSSVEGLTWAPASEFPIVADTQGTAAMSNSPDSTPTAERERAARVEAVLAYLNECSDDIEGAHLAGQDGEVDVWVHTRRQVMAWLGEYLPAALHAAPEDQP